MPDHSTATATLELVEESADSLRHWNVTCDCCGYQISTTLGTDPTFGLENKSYVCAEINDHIQFMTLEGR